MQYIYTYIHTYIHKEPHALTPAKSSISLGSEVYDGLAILTLLKGTRIHTPAESRTPRSSLSL